MLYRLAAQFSAQRPNAEARCVTVSVIARQPTQVSTALGVNWDPARDGARP